MEQHNLDDSDQTSNQSGQWIPIISLPLFYGFRKKRCKCSCGRKFRNQQRYSEHYAYEHLVKKVKVYSKSTYGNDKGKK